MDDRIYCSPSMFINSSESQQTRNAYRMALIEFCISKWGSQLSKDARTYGKMILTEDEEDTLLKQLSEYIREPARTQILEDLQNYRAYLNQRKIKYRTASDRPLSPRTKGHYIAGMQSFLSMNEIRFTSKIHQNTFQIREKGRTDDLPFTVEKAQQTYLQLSHAGKGVFLFMVVTGTRLKAAVNVQLSDIDWKTDPVRVRLRACYSKTGEEGFSFLTKECAEYLHSAWLKPIKYYDRKTKEHLFIPRRELYMRAATDRGRGLREQDNTRKAGERPDIRSDQRLFPMSEATASETLKKAIERAGYVEKNEVGNMKIHPHSTRKMFRNVIGRWGSADAAHTMMQHKPGRDAEYLTLSVEQCAEDFKKAEPYLTIGISAEAREALTTRNAHAVAILDLQSEVAELRQLLPAKEKINEISKVKKKNITR